ncbi:MAG: right-handed parallel beta-helix repeat-containing protein [Cyanobacteria bacterium J06598_3]
MTTYYVSTTGVDGAARDGLSPATAWRSLAYASDRTPAGNHTIQVGPGSFVATEPAYLKSGVTVTGSGREGAQKTQIVASTDWPLSANPRESDRTLDEYLIVLQDAQNVTLKNLVLASEPSHRITGAVYVANASAVTIHDVGIKDFRWVGLQFQRSEQLNVHNNVIENASTEKFGQTNGLIRTRFIKSSDFHRNTITSTTGGYGYKGGGHEDVRINNNTFELDSGFAIESAHENEFGVEISHNRANQTISIPKGRQSADPNSRGYDYSFWIHHNFLTDSYAIEGPRNHLRLSHNYIRVEDTGGNIYTHHGGINNGPVWIHHNVIENVDRGLVWMNQGLAENIYVYNNTVTLANAGPRAGAILSAPNRNDPTQGANNWIAKNNIFIAPDNQVRALTRDNGSEQKMTVEDNVVVNVNRLPLGENNNVELGHDLGVLARGDRPWPFYAPADANSPLVDLGSDVGFPFLGAAPDVGAYELGEQSPFPIAVQPLPRAAQISWERLRRGDLEVTALGAFLLLSMVPIGLVKLKKIR